MSKAKKSILSTESKEALITILHKRFEKNMHRHKGIQWEEVLNRLEANPNKIWSLNEMELSGGEPDVVYYDKKQKEYHFYDCSKETPKGRRSLCYDKQGWNERKEHRPAGNAIDMAKDMGVELINEEQYFYLQSLESFDLKTSSWLLTAPELRSLGGAIFGDCRFNRVFIYHNTAASYYGVRGFRTILIV